MQLLLSVLDNGSSQLLQFKLPPKLPHHEGLYLES